MFAFSFCFCLSIFFFFSLICTYIFFYLIFSWQYVLAHDGIYVGYPRWCPFRIQPSVIVTIHSFSRRHSFYWFCSRGTFFFPPILPQLPCFSPDHFTFLLWAFLWFFLFKSSLKIDVFFQSLFHIDVDFWSFPFPWWLFCCPGCYSCRRSRHARLWGFVGIAKFNSFAA